MSGHRFQDTDGRTQISGLQVSGHIFQDVDLRTQISGHTFQDRFQDTDFRT